jgi:hypothetical protein
MRLRVPRSCPERTQRRTLAVVCAAVWLLAACGERPTVELAPGEEQGETVVAPECHEVDQLQADLPEGTEPTGTTAEPIRDASMPEDERDGVLAGTRLRKLTPHTITKKSDLLSELAKIREDGIAFDRQEFQLGVDCVSAPIWRGGRVAACITVSSPTHRFAETSDEIIRTLVQVTDELRDI